MPVDDDDVTVRAVKRRAATHGRSAEAEQRESLRMALSGDGDRDSFKQVLSSMPDVGMDEDFVFERDMPRHRDELAGRHEHPAGPAASRAT